MLTLFLSKFVACLTKILNFMKKSDLSERLSFFNQELEVMQNEVKRNEGEIKSAYIDMCNSLSDTIYQYKKLGSILF